MRDGLGRESATVIVWVEGPDLSGSCVLILRHLKTFGESVQAFPLSLGAFRFTLCPREPLKLPSHNQTNVLRGFFGTRFDSYAACLNAVSRGSAL